MVCKMENDEVEEMDIEVLSSMWPEDIDGVGIQFNIDRPRAEQDMLQEVTIIEEPKIYDFQRLVELTSYSEKGSSQLAYLVKNWEYKQANAVRLLKEELDNLSKQKHAVELKQLEIIEEHRFVEENYSGDKRPISILDGVYDIWPTVPRRKNDVVVENKAFEVEAEYDTIIYWKQKAKRLKKLLGASVQREQILMEKLQESIKNLERQSSPVEEFSQILERADNFLHFILQTAPVVIGHQDKELKYRFIYNHFPSLNEEEIIGKTDVEIFTGAGVKESEDFKREVLERGLPAKREITFETELFGSKTFLIYVEPVFSKAGDTIGINYMGMEVTDQVIKREKMAKIREEIAVQKARETELNKTIHITEETMRAKQMLATMSHEIRSPLSGVVSMVEILSTTPLDKEQRKLIKVMLSSGDLVLQLINDILDLSKVESGVMKLEATKFRPREVVRHVLQTAAASLQKRLILEGDIKDDVPIEIIGDVLRIRQILTNLISNAIKFTHDGKVGIRLYVIPDPSSEMGKCSRKNLSSNRENLSENGLASEKSSLMTRDSVHANGFHGKKHNEKSNQNHTLEDEPKTPVKNRHPLNSNDPNDPESHEETVWLRCDVYDTGIGIPESALPTLFKKYMQAGADTARKYGGTGLGLAICKQLVELMGGHITVSSREHNGSTFTFIVPYKVSTSHDESYDPHEFSDMVDHDSIVDPNDDDSCGFFQFQPRALGSLFTSSCSSRVLRLSPNGPAFNISNKLNMRIDTEERAFIEDASWVTNGDVSSFANGNLVNGETNHHSSDENGQNTDHSETMQQRDHDEENDIQDRYARSSQCTSSNCSEVPKSSSKPKILLVDDNKINVMVARSMMKQLGHTIDVVNNGIEAVQAVQRNIYDLVLMDVFMPLMDGLQATRLIRSFEETGNWNAAIEAGIEHVPPNSVPSDLEINSSRKRVPIIAMTANALSESAEECYKNGMDSFVSKPVTFQKLKECLERYVP